MLNMDNRAEWGFFGGGLSGIEAAWLGSSLASQA